MNAGSGNTDFGSDHAIFYGIRQSQHRYNRDRTSEYTETHVDLEQRPIEDTSDDGFLERL